ncbi:hypothetical protein P43SY_008862 [Pythium insidiosum]|uniref:Uncharacterized protein n=1 Tax=Pythium insidiosum TaxID=114742 RepID=A0AAD5M8R9_PYTIN|nr:hypothetical protein P43SY_008862 [Pythium insidiosum]
MVSGGGKRVRDGRHGAVEPRGAYPSSRLMVWHSSFAHARSRHAQIVQGHALNQQMELVLPGGAGREVAEKLQWETSFYYEVTAPLSLLLSPRFVADYVLSGSVCMIAKNVALDSSNSAMLLPNGELLLLVDSATYERLGLVGQKYGQDATPVDCEAAAEHRRRRAQRYVVRIDLAAFADDADSASSSSYVARVRDVVASKLQPVEMLLCALNERGAPRTIVFSDDDSLERKRIEVNGKTERLQDVFLPALHEFYRETSRDAMSMEAMRTSLEQVHDWLGIVACRLPDLLRADAAVDDYVSTFTGRPELVQQQQADNELSTVRWRGLFAAGFVQRMLDEARDAVKRGAIPWAALTVWGFQDALVSWQQEPAQAQRHRREKRRSDRTKKTEDTPAAPGVVSREHGYLVNGDNELTFLLLPNDEYFVLQNVGPHDATV